MPDRKPSARTRRLALAAIAAVTAPLWLTASLAPRPSGQIPKPVIDTAQVDIKPMIPAADRYQEGKVFLEHADKWTYEEQPGLPPEKQYQVLVGNVEFRKNDMFMYCDSAHFYENSNSFDAFRNVRMEQGDTLFVYADEQIGRASCRERV